MHHINAYQLKPSRGSRGSATMPAITASRGVGEAIPLHGSRIVVRDSRGRRTSQSGTFTVIHCYSLFVCSDSVMAPLVALLSGFKLRGASLQGS
jgi:hypothetical protein